MQLVYILLKELIRYDLILGHILSLKDNVYYLIEYLKGNLCRCLHDRLLAWTISSILNRSWDLLLIFRICFSDGGPGILWKLHRFNFVKLTCLRHRAGQILQLTHVDESQNGHFLLFFFLLLAV